MKATQTKKSVVTITRKQLEEMLLNWNFGAQPATIQYITEPKINKEGKLKFGNVTKLGAVNCIIDYDFEKAVNRELVKEHKEPNFKVQALWNGKGQHINRRLIQHVETGAKYLAYKYQKGLRGLHFDSALNFIPTALIHPFFYASKPTNQGVNEGKEILARTIKIENIRKLKFRKTTYIIA